jgi:hypothetical protein
MDPQQEALNALAVTLRREIGGLMRVLESVELKINQIVPPGHDEVKKVMGAESWERIAR